MDSERQPSSQSRIVPWNKGRLTGQKRPLKPKDVWAIRVRLQLEHRKRDLALFNLAIDSKLRGCDLVRLQVNDVCAGGRVRDRATIIQKKTGRPVQFEITQLTQASIDAWLSSLTVRNGQYLFPSRFREQPHLSTRQYARIVHAWVASAGLDSSAYGIAHLQSQKEVAMTRSKSTKAVLLAIGVGLFIAAFARSQLAAAEGVGYYGYYYGNPYRAYGTVKRWGAPLYRHDFGHGRGSFGHGGGGGHR